MESQEFNKRYQLIERMLNGEDCEALHLDLYVSSLAAKFDPISVSLQYGNICKELDKEFNAIRVDHTSVSVVEAVRYSYLVSMSTEIKKAEVSAYSTCKEP